MCRNRVGFYQLQSALDPKRPPLPFTCQPSTLSIPTMHCRIGGCLSPLEQLENGEIMAAW